METSESTQVVRSVAWVLAIIAFILAILAHAVLWLALPLVALFVVLFVLGWLIYRPSEDHLAVVYFLGRFERWIPQHEWTLLIPWLEHIKREINLRPQVIRIVVPRIPTQDHLELTGEFNVMFRFDPRHVADELRTTVLDLSLVALEEAVKDKLQMVANDVIGRFTLEVAMDPAGYLRLGQRLSLRLAELLFPLGGVLDTMTSVSVLKLSPDASLLLAWRHKFASQVEGEADLARVAPLIAQVAGYPSRATMNILLAAYAAAIAASGQPPATILNTQVPPPDGLPLNSWWRVVAEGDQEPQLNGKTGTNGYGNHAN